MLIDLLLSKLPLFSALFCLGLATFVLSRKPWNKVNSSFALGMLALALMEFGHFMALHSSLEASYIFWKKVALAGQILLPGPWLLFSLTFGRSSATQDFIRWRLGILATYLLSLVFLVTLVLNWFVTEELILQRGGFWSSIFLLLVLTTVLANFEGTFRSANHAQRWKIKFLLLGVGCIFALMIYSLSQVLLFSSVEHDFSVLISTVILVGCGLITFSFIRHRLLDMNIFVSRYVVYSSITVVVIGAYLLMVGLLAQSIKVLGGDFNSYLRTLFVFLSLLLLASLLLSYNLRKRVKLFINRHFYGNKYDYRKEWLELTDRLSFKLDAAELLPPLANMIFETFWIKRTILWLYEDSQQEFQLVQSPEGFLRTTMKWSPNLIQALRERDYPLVLDHVREDPGLSVIDDQQQAAFQSMGIGILVPLIVEKRLVGILGLSKSYSGTPLSDEDYDLMKTIAKQAASSFLNAKLSQKLVSSKELETFHSFSTFLLHDLKNFVSMLSLVVENMNRNFDNPEFRKDALISLSQMVDKMKRLMERLASLSRSSGFCYVPADLNELTEDALSEIRSAIKSQIVKKFQKLPIVRVDPLQIKKVITNLILNAEEAISGPGFIHLTTSVEDEAVTLAVSDNGCGMPPEFIENRLFKPFATTKANGFGIGLYQSKSILEAQGGKIQAYSQLGQGSTFKIYVPIAKE
jgi:hypothetical protein